MSGSDTYRDSITDEVESGGRNRRERWVAIENRNLFA
jgi:hypothetical protein